MRNVVVFDVLVVYTESQCVSAGDSMRAKTPFKQDGVSSSYNVVYGYFLEICRRNGLRAALTTSADVVGPGECSSYWTYTDKRWIRTKGRCRAEVIFDKFSPTRAKIKRARQLLFSSDRIRPFNDPELFAIFFDKLQTYESLSGFAIPTLALLGGDRSSVSTACKQLTNMQDESMIADFDDEIVLKDRFGAGGRRVYKFGSSETDKIVATLARHPNNMFVIQPLAKFDQGFIHEGRRSPVDIRLIFLRGKIVQTYIRIAKTDDFRCNEHQGGKLKYIAISAIPDTVIKQAYLVAEKLDKEQSFFALDFIVCNSGRVYLLEGNTGPGLDWNLDLPKNEKEAKRLIRLVVGDLRLMAESNTSLVDSKEEEIAAASYLGA